MTFLLFLLMSLGATAPRTHLPIVSMQENFEIFWQKAKGKSNTEQLILWDQYVERPHQAFFDSVVWDKKKADWQDRKNKRLSQLLSKYPDLYPKISANFVNFDKILQTKFQAFSEKFKDANKITAPVYAALSPNFNGKSAILTNGKNKQIILAFGLDMMAERNDDIDVLFPHELFHLYHASVSDIKNDGVEQNENFMLPLWSEGLATYVSSVFSPEKNDGSLLMDPDLGKVKKSDLPFLAKEFTKIREMKISEQNGELYASWFSIRGNKLRTDLPSRCGYFLGLNLVRQLAKSHSLEEMVSWHKNEIYKKVSAGLTNLEAQK